eukprot:SAG11_NODE_1001_length_6220_cov_6.550400_6_plen_135_part_00
MSERGGANKATKRRGHDSTGHKGQHRIDMPPVESLLVCAHRDSAQQQRLQHRQLHLAAVCTGQLPKQIQRRKSSRTGRWEGNAIRGAEGAEGCPTAAAAQPPIDAASCASCPRRAEPPSPATDRHEGLRAPGRK